MAARTIENPVINSPFEEPKRHFVFTDEGISDTIAQGRRKSVYFNPIAKGGEYTLRNAEKGFEG